MVRIRFFAGLMGLMTLISSGTAQGQVVPGPPSDTEVIPELADDLHTAPSPCRLWMGAEYLLWWFKNGPTPGPLVTTSPANASTPGVLGAPETRVVFGDEGLDYKGHSGVRLTLGRWLDTDQTFSIEAVGFLLETHTLHFKQDSDRSGFPVTARPFVNALTGGEDAKVITAPGKALGGIDIFSDSRIWGGEANLNGCVCRDCQLRADVLAGFRYLGLKEELRFSQSSTLLARGVGSFLGSPVPPPDIISIRDYVETNDQFYGGQIGIHGEYHWQRWTVDAVGKVGCGLTSDDVEITGHTLTTDPARRNALALGGLFTNRSNIGWDSHDRFSLIAEVGVSVGCELTSCLSLYVGYDFLFWGDVARPGDQLSLRVNPAQIPSNPLFGMPATAPVTGRSFHSSDIWAQGLTCGLALRF